jgi:hypothetical protein
MDGFMVLMFIIIMYWLSPIILIILGLTQLKSNPKSAKINLIIAGVMLTIGFGFCGLLLGGI